MTKSGDGQCETRMSVRLEIFSLVLKVFRLLRSFSEFGVLRFLSEQLVGVSSRVVDCVRNFHTVCFCSSCLDGLFGGCRETNGKVGHNYKHRIGEEHEASPVFLRSQESKIFCERSVELDSGLLLRRNLFRFEGQSIASRFVSCLHGTRIFFQRTAVLGRDFLFGAGKERELAL
jgi:hypothetical protein